MQVGDRYLEALSHRPRARRVGTIVLAIAAHVGVVAAIIVAGFWRVDELPVPPHANLIVLIAATPAAPAAPIIARGSPRGTTTRVAKHEPLTQPNSDPAPTPPSSSTDEPLGDPNGKPDGDPHGVPDGDPNGPPNGVPHGNPQLPQLIAPTVGAAQRIGGDLPRYSDRARGAGIEGTVAVKICVSPQGGVSSTTLLRGLPLLDESVLNTIRGWRYKPFTVGGQAMPFCYVANFEFHLQGR